MSNQWFRIPSNLCFLMYHFEIAESWNHYIITWCEFIFLPIASPRPVPPAPFLVLLLCVNLSNIRVILFKGIPTPWSEIDTWRHGTVLFLFSKIFLLKLTSMLFSSGVYLIAFAIGVLELQILFYFRPLIRFPFFQTALPEIPIILSEDSKRSKGILYPRFIAFLKFIEISTGTIPTFRLFGFIFPAKIFNP